MSAAGDFLKVLNHAKMILPDDFTLQNERRRRKFLRFGSPTKGFCLTKISTAGENIVDNR